MLSEAGWSEGQSRAVEASLSPVVPQLPNVYAFPCVSEL